jgi:hypothetical protein
MGVTFGTAEIRLSCLDAIQAEIDSGTQPEPVEGEGTSAVIDRCGLCGRTKNLPGRSVAGPDLR